MDIGFCINHPVWGIVKIILHNATCRYRCLMFASIRIQLPWTGRVGGVLVTRGCAYNYRERGRMSDRYSVLASATKTIPFLPVTCYLFSCSDNAVMQKIFQTISVQTNRFLRHTFYDLHPCLL